MLLETSCKHSLVPGLPKIIHEEDGCCKLLRVCIFLTCLAGLYYQTSHFFSFYFSNATYTETVITDTGNLIVPALTFCNRSPASREQYCENNPGYCDPIHSSSFCNFYSYYCNNYSSSLPIPNRKPSLLQRENALYFSFPEVYSGQKKVETLNYTYTKKLDELLPCSSVNFHGYYPEKYGNLINVSTYPDALPFSEFTATYDRSDLLHYNYPPTVVFGIHSPLDTQFADIELRLSNYYDEEHRLLRAPYSDCRNYREEYRTSNHTGPWSKQMCQMFCEIQPYLDACGCFQVPLEWLGIIIPAEFLCKTAWYNFPVEDGQCTYEKKFGKNPVNADACLAECKEDCVKWIYYAEILPRKETFFHESIAVHVNIQFKDFPVTIISHKPLYEFVEIFTCIGGYLGLWLGLCMISAADLLLSIFNNLFVSFYKCIVRLKKILFK